MKKNKVIQLITGLNVGGAEKVVYDLSRELNGLNFSVFVVCISNKHKLLDDFLNAGINTSVLSVVKHPLSFFKGVKDLLTLVNKEDIKIIHAHMTHAFIMAFMVKLFKPAVKIIFTSHNSNLGSKLRKPIIRLLKPFRSKDIIFSESMKDKTYKKYDTVIIPNGIDTALYKIDIDKNKIFTYLAIGRIEPVKNHKLLIDAAVKLKDIFSFQIHIIGEGILSNDLQDYIIQHKVEHIVKLLGYRKDINIICNKSHVFVLPSLWEGLPISMLEAGASSIPVISTPVGSIPELISNDMGYLSDVSGFADVMKYVYFNYAEASKKGQSLNKKIVKEYDLNRIALAHKNLYESLLQH